MINICSRRIRGRRAFTLVELMVALGISTFAIIAMFSAFLVFVRGSLSVSSYAEMSAQSRKTLEILARDVRMAKNIRTSSAVLSNGFVQTNGSMTLSYPTGFGSDVIYSVVSTPEGDNFIRTQGGVPETMLIGVQNVAIKFFQIPKMDDITKGFSEAPADLSSISNPDKNGVMSIQLDATLVRDVGQSQNTDYIISARFKKRNRNSN